MVTFTVFSDTNSDLLVEPGAIVMNMHPFDVDLDSDPAKKFYCSFASTEVLCADKKYVDEMTGLISRKNTNRFRTFCQKLPPVSRCF